MTPEQAVEIALATVREGKAKLESKPVEVSYQERRMGLGKGRCGWLVVVPLKVPEGFEPAEMYVEVYEPDGQVNIRWPY